MPIVHWQRRKWAKWVSFGLLAVWAVGSILFHDPANRWDVFGNLGFWGMLPIFFILATGPHFLLVPGVLASFGRPGGSTYIPLRRSELKRVHSGLHLRYPAGKLMRAMTLRVPPPFAMALERAVADAAAEEPGVYPETPKEAERALPIGLRPESNWVGAGVLVGWFLPLVLAVLTNQPWYLVVIPLVPVALDRYTWSQCIILYEDRLWLLTEGQETRSLPLQAITAVTQAGATKWRIATADPAMPELLIQSDGALPKALKQRLAGEPAEPFTAAESPADSGPSVSRCTLCGTPAQGAHGGVYVCDRCAGRARVEAHESGHGLAGKDRKPM